MKETYSNRQFILACCLIFFGCCLICAGFIVEPTGKIDSSVLVAFGEVLTFAGAVMGIDYAYQNKK